MSIVEDAEQIDQAFDSVEEILEEALGEYEIEDARVDRWRWDEPTIVLSWEGEDSICRNIGVYFDKNNEEFEVEENAWVDSDMRDFDEISSDEPVEEGVVRFWYRNEVGQAPLDSIDELIYPACIDLMYKTWEDLDRRTRIKS